MSSKPVKNPDGLVNQTLSEGTLIAAGRHWLHAAQVRWPDTHFLLSSIYDKYGRKDGIAQCDTAQAVGDDGHRYELLCHPQRDSDWSTYTGDPNLALLGIPMAVHLARVGKGDGHDSYVRPDGSRVTVDRESLKTYALGGAQGFED